MNKTSSLNIVILGLSITSSWGNGHATTYRSIVKGLSKRGHHVTFLERDVPWYAENRDLAAPPYGKTYLYNSLKDLQDRFSGHIRSADIVIIGSYVPEGIDAAKIVFDTAGGLTAFYDIDTPVTLSKLERNDYEYISPDIIPFYNIYLSFSGGPILKKIEQEFGSPNAKPFYCSFDPDDYYEESLLLKWDLGYLGTYSKDRQPKVNELMINTSSNYTGGKFVTAGPGYPEDIKWKNVERINHLPPGKHREFYNSQRFTLNITRDDMVKAGYSPSVRLFEAAACGTPIISDYWNGLEEFFEINEEIFIAANYNDVINHLKMSDAERKRAGKRARTKVMELHTSKHRAAELENYYNELTAAKV